MTWNPYSEPIDWVDLAGHMTPGIAEIVGAGSPRRWDERESVGWSGAYLVYHGQNLSHFSLNLKLYTPEHWLDWHAFKHIVQRVPLGKRQKPLDIMHPLLNDLGIHAVVVEDVLGAALIDETGIWQIEIKLIEYRSPRLALAAAQGSQATPDDPEDAIIAERRREFDALGSELERAERIKDHGRAGTTQP